MAEETKKPPKPGRSSFNTAFLGTSSSSRLSDDSRDSSKTGSPIPLPPPAPSSPPRNERISLFSALNSVTAAHSSDSGGESSQDVPQRCKNCESHGHDDEDEYFDWVWDSKYENDSVQLQPDRREVLFHPLFSNGTSAIRGDTPFIEGQHYWEIKMTTSIYGTDVMIGVGTDNVSPEQYKHLFISLLGRDADSWGLSYVGALIHQNVRRSMCKRIVKGTVIGIHLDMWLGKMSFYKNGKYLGVGFSNLGGKKLYPFACSTAARTGMKLVKATSTQSSLQFMCLQVLRRQVPKTLDLAKAMHIPPGLQAFLTNNIGWLLRPYGKQESSSVSLAAISHASDEQTKFNRKRVLEDDDVCYGDEAKVKVAKLV